MVGIRHGSRQDKEYVGNRGAGDADDVIKIKSGIGMANVRLVRGSYYGNHLYVQLLGEADANGDRAVTDSLTVDNYYIDDSAKIERLEFEDGTTWDENDFMLAPIRGGGRS